jgi:hypothetical protein
MPSSSTSFSSCSVKLIRNCIPSLHLFSTSSRPPPIPAPNKWPVELIEAVCIEALDLTKRAESEEKFKVTSRSFDYLSVFYFRYFSNIASKYSLNYNTINNSKTVVFLHR